jgi:hypothetical protein
VQGRGGPTVSGQPRWLSVPLPAASPCPLHWPPDSFFSDAFHLQTVVQLLKVGRGSDGPAWLSTSGLGVSVLPSSGRATPLANGTASFKPGRGGRVLLRRWIGGRCYAHPLGAFQFRSVLPGFFLQLASLAPVMIADEGFVVSSVLIDAW